MKTLAPLLILLLILPTLTPLSRGVCPQMGVDCDHGDACPVRAQQAAMTEVCHTGGHSGHDDTGGEEACGGKYIGCDDGSSDVVNVLDIPCLVDRGSPGRLYALQESILPPLAGKPAPFLKSSEKPPETTLIS